VADLGATLTRAADNPLSPAMVQKSLPPVWGRIAAEDWMYH
jgi:hypothetical protein